MLPQKWCRLAHIVSVLLLFVVAMLLTSCTTDGTTSPTSTTSGALPTTPGTLTTAQQAALSALEVTGNLAMASQKAGADKTAIAVQLVAFGQAVQGLASGSVVTPTQLNAAIASTSPKVATQVATYQAITSAISSLWAAEYPTLSANKDVATATGWLSVFAQAAVAVGTANGGASQ